ncbi:MAG: hypothetical protein KAG98_07365, partial [Lentisphaeria bacterium]|nr:hypothetical protein [Lentisphaeria bacterium]
MNRYKTIVFGWLLLVTSFPLWSADSATAISGVVANVPHAAFSEVDYFTTDAPRQTGLARRSSPILYSGFYELPVSLQSDVEVYNVGQQLPVLTKDGKRYTFIRGIDDYYTNRNYVWTAEPGELSIHGTPGNIPLHSKMNAWIDHDGVDAILGSDGVLTKIFRDHPDEAFDDFPLPSGTGRAKGPIWKTKKGNSGSSFSYKISLNAIQTRLGQNDASRPDLQQVKLKFAFYDISTSNAASVSLKVNGDSNPAIEFPLSTSKREKVMTASFPLSYLGLNSTPNIVDLTVLKNGDGGAFRYDFTELYIPCLKHDEGYLLVDHTKQDGTLLQQQLLVEVEPSAVERFIKVKDATFALDVTTMGGESFLESTPNGFRIPVNQETVYLYFSNEAKALTFSAPKQLTAPDLSHFDYIAIAQKDANYFTQYRDDRPDDHAAAKLWDRQDDSISKCMNSVYSANLYNTWETTQVNGKTIFDVLRLDGHKPILVSLEEVIDIYGGGIISPRAIEVFLGLQTSQTIENVCLVGGTSVDTKKRQVWSDGDTELSFFVQTLGLPSKLYYGHDYLGFIYSDDCYAGVEGQRITRSVGRIPVFTDAGLKAWLEKRIVYQPGDKINLIAGENQPSGSLAFPFDKEQKALYGLLPSTLMTVKQTTPRLDEQHSSSNLLRKWQEAIAADVSLSFYQGHGTISFLSEFNSEILDTKTVRSKPSCFVLATCDTGKYYKGALDESTNEASLTYMLMTGKSAGDVTNSVIDTLPVSTKGAVNLIASTGFTGAVWENIYTKKMVRETRETEELTWGELVNCKYQL